MKVTITGGTGFVGSATARHFSAKGYQVSAIGSSVFPEAAGDTSYARISADTTAPGPWQRHVEQADIIINLAGRTIFKRWTKRYKQVLRDSRILTTRHVVDALRENAGQVLISASATGYYGDRRDEILPETASSGENFLAGLSADWEQEALAAARKGTRVVIARLGIVLDAGGGAMGKMIPAFRFFLGGPLGSGRQWFSWIHMQDVIRAMDFAAITPDIRGAVNFCAPNPVQNRKLAQAIGTAVHRPALIPTPGWAVRLAFGEFGATLLESQRAVAGKLLDSGFRFQYPEIQGALAQIVHG
jgi:uncharacterized protein (TIGR01777 family)